MLSPGGGSGEPHNKRKGVKGGCLLSAVPGALCPPWEAWLGFCLGP